MTSCPPKFLFRQVAWNHVLCVTFDKSTNCHGSSTEIRLSAPCRYWVGALWVKYDRELFGSFLSLLWWRYDLAKVRLTRISRSLSMSRTKVFGTRHYRVRPCYRPLHINPVAALSLATELGRRGRNRCSLRSLEPTPKPYPIRHNSPSSAHSSETCFCSCAKAFSLALSCV